MGSCPCSCAAATDHASLLVLLRGRTAAAGARLPHLAPSPPSSTAATPAPTWIRIWLVLWLKGLCCCSSPRACTGAAAGGKLVVKSRTIWRSRGASNGQERYGLTHRETGGGRGAAGGAQNQGACKGILPPAAVRRRGPAWPASPQEGYQMNKRQAERAALRWLGAVGRQEVRQSACPAGLTR